MTTTLLTVRQVASELNCSVAHVYNLIRNGSMEAINIAEPTKRIAWRIPPHAVEEFRNRQQEEEE